MKLIVKYAGERSSVQVDRDNVKDITALKETIKQQCPQYNLNDVSSFDLYLGERAVRSFPGNPGDIVSSDILTVRPKSNNEEQQDHSKMQNNGQSATDSKQQDTSKRTKMERESVAPVPSSESPEEKLWQHFDDICAKRDVKYSRLKYMLLFIHHEVTQLGFVRDQEQTGAHDTADEGVRDRELDLFLETEVLLLKYFHQRSGRFATVCIVGHDLTNADCQLELSASVKHVSRDFVSGRLLLPIADYSLYEFGQRDSRQQSTTAKATASSFVRLSDLHEDLQCGIMSRIRTLTCGHESALLNALALPELCLQLCARLSATAVVRLASTCSFAQSRLLTGNNASLLWNMLIRRDFGASAVPANERDRSYLATYKQLFAAKRPTTVHVPVDFEAILFRQPRRLRLPFLQPRLPPRFPSPSRSPSPPHPDRPPGYNPLGPLPGRHNPFAPSPRMPPIIGDPLNPFDDNPYGQPAFPDIFPNRPGAGRNRGRGGPRFDPFGGGGFF